MIKSAVLSKNRLYRYALTRVWRSDLPTVMFIGLNPSIADENIDDPTLLRCIGFADSWGYGGVVMANLFAYRATLPAEMKKAKNPIGRGNNQWLQKLAGQSEIVIAAWGNDGGYLTRSQQVRKLIPGLHYLRLNKSGEPAHPLYLPASLSPVIW